MLTMPMLVKVSVLIYGGDDGDCTDLEADNGEQADNGEEADNGVGADGGDGPSPASEQASVNTLLVKGSVRRYYKFWEKNFVDKFILDIVKRGYKLPFISNPARMELRNNLSAIKHADFVSKEIRSLLKKGCVTQCDAPPFVVNPLSVAVNSNGKPRLILDLRQVNLHLFKFGVKYEGLKELAKYTERNGFLVKFDLKSGYHHIDIFSEHTTYLGFSWKLDGEKKYFKFLSCYNLLELFHIFYLFFRYC